MIQIRADAATVTFAAGMGLWLIGLSCGFWLRDLTISAEDARAGRAAERMIEDAIRKLERIDSRPGGLGASLGRDAGGAGSDPGN